VRKSEWALVEREICRRAAVALVQHPQEELASNLASDAAFKVLWTSLLFLNLAQLQKQVTASQMRYRR
jgi:hypothetical protein